VVELNDLIDKLAAAYIKETKLKASDCILVQRPNKFGGYNYSFEPKVDLNKIYEVEK
jgi:hypothetical protein